MLEPLSPATPTTPEKKKKKKDKKKKDKERIRRSVSGTPPPISTTNRDGKANEQETKTKHSGNSNVNRIPIIDSPSTKNPDDQALSESELESRRAALLAQLNMQMDE